MNGGGVIVNFDYDTWSVLYPQLASQVPEVQADAFFAMAQLWLRNDGCCRICNPQVKIQLYYLLVAHLATLNLQQQRANGAPGRVANATMGSVSIGLDYPMLPASAWYNQTGPGAAYWDATKPWRRMYYIPGPVRAVDPWFDWLSNHKYVAHGSDCGCGCKGKGIWVDGVTITGSGSDTPLTATCPDPAEPEEKRKRLLKLLKLLVKDQVFTHKDLGRIKAGEFGDLDIDFDDLDVDDDDDNDNANP
jgi:hypothetical protein